MITALKKIYAFSGRWKGVLKKSVVFSLLHSIFDMFQIGALFLILNGLVEGLHGQNILFAFLLLLAGVIGKIISLSKLEMLPARCGRSRKGCKRLVPLKSTSTKLTSRGENCKAMEAIQLCAISDLPLPFVPATRPCGPLCFS